MDDGSRGWDGGDAQRDESESLNPHGAGDTPVPVPSQAPDATNGPNGRSEGSEAADEGPSLPDESDAEDAETPRDERRDEHKEDPKANRSVPRGRGPDPQDTAAPTPQGGSRRAEEPRPSHASAAEPGSDAVRRDAPLFEVHSLSNFLSTSRIPQQLDALVARCLQRDARLDHILVHGSIGSGTKLLALALINDYAPRRVVEIDATLGCDAELLRRSIDEVGPRGVLFIRHIDALETECDQLLAEALSGKPPRSRRPRGFVDPTESELDRAISASATARDQAGDARPNDFTLIATAHLMTQVGYIVRTRVEHLFHLRDDPKALRNAVLRALRRHGSISVEAAALPQLERVLKSLVDAAEPITRAALLRCDCDGIRAIDAEIMRSILEEDLASRLPDEAYSSSLRRHLAGRKIEQVTPEEVSRIACETGWGSTASEAALSMMLREEQRRRVA